MHVRIRETKISVATGFTLVETLVAVSILLVVIIGPMTIAMKGMQNGYFANEQTTAVFLAQEALESVKKVRDDYALQVLDLGTGDTSDWYSSELDSACRSDFSQNGCGYNPVTTLDPYIACGTSGCVVTQNMSSTEYRYSHDTGSGWEPTIYTRKLVVTEQVPDVAWEVVSTVNWNARIYNNAQKTVVLRTWIYNQYAQP